MDSFGLIDTDALVWTETDVRMGLIRVANDPKNFPNEHVLALIGVADKWNGAAYTDWRKMLVAVADNSAEKLIESRHARIIVGMQAEDNSGPERSAASPDTAMQVDENYIP